MATLWKCVAERSGNPPCPLHAARRTHYAYRRRLTPLAGDNIDAPATCAVPFCPYCGGVVTPTRNVSEYMLVLALCLVFLNGSRLHLGFLKFRKFNGRKEKGIGSHMFAETEHVVAAPHGLVCVVIPTT